MGFTALATETGAYRYTPSISSMTSGDTTTWTLSGLAYTASNSGGGGSGSGTSSGGTVTSGSTQVISGGTTVSNTNISGGTQAIENGGTAVSTTIGSNGTQILSSGGVASATTISGGGTQAIENGGTAVSTTIASNGIQNVASGGTAVATTVRTGGTQNVVAPGIAISAAIDEGGLQNVYAGGIASATSVSAGGTQAVGSGGTVFGTIIHNGGTQHVLSGGTSKAGILAAGGTEIVEDYATAELTSLSGGTISLNDTGAATLLLNGTGTSYTADTLNATGDTVQFVSAGTYKTLNIGMLNGYASFVLNSDLANGKSDQINITSAVNSNANTVKFYDVGYGTASISGTAAFATAPSTVGFTALPTETGAYRYTPTITSAASGGTTIWTLTGLAYAAMSGGTSTVLEASESIQGARDQAAAMAAVWRSEMNNVERRMGDLRGETGSAGAWGRVYHGRQTVQPGGRMAHNDYTALQLGWDHDWTTRQGDRFLTGIAMSYTNGSMGLARGGGDFSSTAAAVYGTWMGCHGHYADIIAKYGWLDNDYYSYLDDGIDTKVNGRYKAQGQSISLEYGWRDRFKDGSYIEPQAELTFGHIGGDNYQLSDGTSVHVDGLSSVIGRLGFALGNKSGHTSWYAKLSLAREFSAEAAACGSSYGLGSVGSRASLKETWLEWSVGLNGRLSDRTRYYLEYMQTTGSKLRTNYQFNAGLRWSW